jgi:hypothetical protein
MTTSRIVKREYQIARQLETAHRLRTLANMIYGKDPRSEPMHRVASLLSDASQQDLPSETSFLLNLIVDAVLNDFRPNQRPTPIQPSDIKDTVDD